MAAFFGIWLIFNVWILRIELAANRAFATLTDDSELAWA